MTYVDTCVVLAELFCERQRPDPSFWTSGDLVSSRLTEFECWVRLHAYGKAVSHGAALVNLLARIDLVAVDEGACMRCRAPFPTPVRTLDALHLATADSLRMAGFVIDVASYDLRLRQAAQAMGFGIAQM